MAMLAARLQLPWLKTTAAPVSAGAGVAAATHATCATSVAAGTTGTTVADDTGVAACDVAATAAVAGGCMCVPKDVAAVPATGTPTVRRPMLRAPPPQRPAAQHPSPQLIWRRPRAHHTPRASHECCDHAAGWTAHASVAEATAIALAGRGMAGGCRPRAGACGCTIAAMWRACALGTASQRCAAFSRPSSAITI